MVALAKNAAFLGLQPSTNPKNYAYLGLVADSVPTPPTPPEQFGGGSSYRRRRDKIAKKLDSIRIRQLELEEEEILIMYYALFE
jgi:hypothetical protein